MRFACDDTEYADVPTNFRGEVILARLLTKIVEFQKRNVFIADRLKDLIKEPGRRILVLSERIGHLEALENLLKPTGCVMGYYIGGMKSAVRDLAAEEAQILWATYAMASEAMNIKTLNTVLMASPRKKIEQSTGRILRQRPEERKVDPLIIDIIDVHRSMQSQARQRIAYYKKCGYNVIDGFNKKNKENDKEIVPEMKAVPLKPINFPASIILLWIKAIDGDKVVQLWLRENGYEALFHATNAIYLIQDSRDWLMENGYAHLMAMINTSEGLVQAQQWLMAHKMELLFHIGRAVDHENDSWEWLGKNATPDLFMLAKSIQFIKDKIEENHRDIHSFGKDL
jgi:hypothetical protein